MSPIPYYFDSRRNPHPSTAIFGRIAKYAFLVDVLTPSILFMEFPLRSPSVLRNGPAYHLRVTFMLYDFYVFCYAKVNGLLNPFKGWYAWVSWISSVMIY